MGDVFQTYLLRTQHHLDLIQEGFPENENIQRNVGQMVSKKKLWKEKLELQWQNRRRPLFTQWDVRTTNYQYRLTQAQEETLLVAQNMYSGPGASERQWVLGTRPCEGGIHIQINI